jgi:hypothetical protein
VRVRACGCGCICDRYQGWQHAPFKLNKDGETVKLYGPDGADNKKTLFGGISTLGVKTINLPRQAEDKHRKGKVKGGSGLSAGTVVDSLTHPQLQVRKTASFSEFSLCLSRACLGNIVFIYKWLKNAGFRRTIRRSAVSTTAATPRSCCRPRHLAVRTLRSCHPESRRACPACNMAAQ